MSQYPKHEDHAAHAAEVAGWASLHNSTWEVCAGLTAGLHWGWRRLHFSSIARLFMNIFFPGLALRNNRTNFAEASV